MSFDDNIFIVYFRDDDDFRGPTEPTLSPTDRPPQREVDFRVCHFSSQNNNKQGVDDDVTQDTTMMNGASDSQVEAYYNHGMEELWGVAPIQFLYEVQMNDVTSSLPVEATEVLLSSMSNAIIDSIYENECSISSSSINSDTESSDDLVMYNEGDNNGDNRRLDVLQLRREVDEGSALSVPGSRRRNLGIQSISPGSGHHIKGECNSTIVDNSAIVDSASEGTCNEVEGLLVIGFDDIGEASTYKSVGELVLSRIQQDMSEGTYLARVNQELVPFNVYVTDIKFIESDYLGMVDRGVFSPLNSADWVQAESGLSTFSKVAIPIIAILFLLMLCFCWCAYTTHGKMMRKRLAVFFYEDENDDEFDDDYNDHFEPYRQPDEVEPKEQIEAQPNSLSKRSSYMDVPHCNKPQCRLCRHRNNHRAVSMIGELSPDFGGEENDACFDSPSLETTFQDISDIKIRDYRDDAYAVTGRSRTYSTIPHQSRSRFALASTTKRTPSLIRIVAEDKHHKNDFYDEPDMVNFVKVNPVIDRAVIPKKQHTQQKSKAKKTNGSSWGLISSWFARDQRDEEDGTNNAISCTPRLANFTEVAEDERSDDNLDFNSIPIPRNTTVVSFTPSEPKPEPSPTTHSLSSTWMNMFSFGNDNSDTVEMGNETRHENDRNLRRERSMEDSILIREPHWFSWPDSHGNQHVRRQRSLENLREAPIEIGRKRTWTDGHGRVRQEVAL